MSWATIVKKNRNIVTKIEENKSITENTEKEFTISNDEYFYLTKGSKLLDYLFDVKKEAPPWLFSKIATYDFYEFWCSFIGFEDIESEYIENISESEDEYYE